MSELEEVFDGKSVSGFLGVFLIFRYLCQQDDNKGEGKDCQSGVHERERIANLGIDDGGDKQSCEDDNGSAAKRVERAAKLDELVSFVSAATEAIEHGIDYGVEQAHGEACDKGTEQINRETFGKSRKQLDTYAGEAYAYGDKGCFLVTPLLQHLAGRNTHDGIGDEVGKDAESAQKVGCTKLALEDITHGRGQIGDEGDHAEEQDHHDDRDGIGLFLFHFSFFFRYNVIM